MKTLNKMDIPVKYQSVFASASKSRAMAVKANCIACCGFMVAEARDCKRPDCPLYNWNPYRKARLKRENK